VKHRKHLKRKNVELNLETKWTNVFVITRDSSTDGSSVPKVLHDASWWPVEVQPALCSLSRANKFLNHAATLAFVVKSNYDPVCDGKRRLQTQNFRRNTSFKPSGKEIRMTSLRNSRAIPSRTHMYSCSTPFIDNIYVDYAGLCPTLLL